MGNWSDSIGQFWTDPASFLCSHTCLLTTAHTLRSWMLTRSMHQFCSHAVTQYGVWPAVRGWMLPELRSVCIWVYLTVWQEMFDIQTLTSCSCWKNLFPLWANAKDNSSTKTWTHCRFLIICHDLLLCWLSFQLPNAEICANMQAF